MGRTHTHTETLNTQELMQTKINKHEHLSQKNMYVHVLTHLTQPTRLYTKLDTLIMH